MKDFFRNNGVLILIAAILLALVTAVVSALLGGGANPLANLVNIVTTPVRSGISAVAGWAEEKYNDSTRPPSRRTSGCGTSRACGPAA